MKVVFLDIDGVLNSSDSTLAKIGLTMMSTEQRAAVEVLTERLKTQHGDLPYGAKFALLTSDPVAVGLMNRFLRETDARIVLSSTHRSNFAREQDGGMMYGGPEHLKYLQIYLHALGLVGDRLVGITPPYSGKQRGEEVAQYLEWYDIEKYVIIDDGTDFLPGQPLIWCDPHKGFSREEFTAACLTLGSKQGMILTLGDIE